MLRKVVLGLAAPLLLVAGSCARSVEGTKVLTGDVTLAALRSAPDAAAKAGSAHFEMTVTVKAPGGAFDLVATGGFSGHQMTMEMDLGSVLDQAAAASGDTVPAGFDEPVQIVVDGTAMYLRIPMLNGLTGGAGWLSISAADMGSAGSSLGLGAGSNDPAQVLETLRGVAGDIAEVGSDEVRGVATTHVRATVDVAKALERVPAERRALLKAQLDRVDAGAAGIPVDVWVDADGLVRRLVMDLGALPEAAATGGAASMTLDFFDYGRPVEVVVPDASDTTPFTEVLGAVGDLG